MTDLIRGAVVTFGERGEFTAKPRPGIVIQRSSMLADAATVTICGLTTTVVATSRTRIPIFPSPLNGLRQPSFVMIDKISSISRGRVGKVIGRLTEAEEDAVDVALRRWLDL